MSDVRSEREPGGNSGDNSGGVAPARRIPVAVYGATGTVGQRFLTLLADHPWFEVAALCASERSAGRRYGDAVTWVQDRPLPAGFAERVVEPCVPEVDAGATPLVFSALDTQSAARLERSLAGSGALVVTNAGAHRMDVDVPLVVPEVNADHLDLLPESGGAIVANPNCSTIGLALALAPLDRALGVEVAHVVSLQAVSGAGHPGISSLEVVDNVVPFIAGEADKLETEPRKILGRLEGGAIRERELTVGARCNRVPVLDGHVLCVSVRLAREADAARLRTLWEEFAGPPQELSLPSAPPRPCLFLDPPAVPQPRLHRGLGGGMSAVIGGLEPCPVLDWRFVALSHNTVRGAAGGALLAAELAVARRAAPLAPWLR